MSAADVLTYDSHPDEALAEEVVEAINRPRRGGSEALDPDAPGGWLPKLSLPSFGEAYEECGDERPHFCSECAEPIPVGRTCARSVCPRCWSAWVTKRAGTSREQGRDVPGIVAQLDKTARMMSSRLGTAVFKHHVVFSPPMDDWFLEAADPLERTKEVIKECMDAMNLEGAIFYHSWSGDNEDLEGDDRGEWKHRIGRGREWEGDVRDELIPRGHFHVVGCSPFVPTDGVTDVVHDETGWVIKRVTDRGGEGRSLADLDAVARAVTYCLSHTGIDTSGSTNQAQYWKHGSTYHSGSVPEDVAEAADAAVRRAVPTTLGVSARRITCYNEVPEGVAADHCGDASFSVSGGDGVEADDGPATTAVDDSPATAADGGVKRVTCSGAIYPIREAGSFLADDEWREQAPFAKKLQRVFEEWRDGPPD